MKRKILEWASDAWRKLKAMIKTVLKENPRGERPLGRLRIRWEDCIRRHVADFYPDGDWHM
jgi:hypothetical protein